MKMAIDGIAKDRRWRRGWLLLALTVAIAGGAAWLLQRSPGAHDWSSAPPELQALMWPTPRPLPAFTMIDQTGAAFGDAGLKGHWSLLYFGYLQCPDVCPTTLQSLRAMQKLMAADAGMPVPRIVFVSVDPTNDTPERIGAYLKFFGDDLIGLSGDAAQLATLAQSLGVSYAEYRDASGTRSMDHTTSIIVVDPQGRGVGALPAPHQAATMLQQFQRLRQFIAM